MSEIPEITEVSLTTVHQRFVIQAHIKFPGGSGYAIYTPSLTPR